MPGHVIDSIFSYIPSTIMLCIKGRSGGGNRPSLKQLNDHVVQEVAVKWRDIGVQLFDDSAKSILDIIEADHKDVSNFMSM